MVAKALFEYGVFQSTLPIQGETLLAACEIYGGIFQSTLPIQGETELADYIEAKRKISIHSPYTGRDDLTSLNKNENIRISIHSPYTGRDTNILHPRGIQFTFQSTLPIQGET